MTLILILLFIFLLIVFPFPLKIEITLHKNIFILRLFKFRLFSSTNGIENKLVRKFINKSAEAIEPKTKIKAKKKQTKRHTFIKKKKVTKKLSFKKLYTNISCSKFKPLLKIRGNLDFGVDDAAYCAIIYGFLNNIPPLLTFLLDKIFKVKGININISPKFNTNTLSLGITSIFYLNIANIIYILYLIHKSFEIKEVTP